MLGVKFALVQAKKIGSTQKSQTVSTGTGFNPA